MEKDTPNYYAIIPANVRYDKRLCPNAKLLYGEISALCNKKGFCWANNNYFEELYQVGKRTIQKWIASLVECGYIYCNFRYYENSKVVSDRCLSIIECCENSYPMNINSYPYEKKDIGGYEKKDTHNNTSINNTSNNTYIYSLFSEFYNLYPRKVNKKKAQEKYYSILKKSKNPEETANDILEGLKRYIDFWERDKTELQFIPHPTTWLNGERWNDDLKQSNKKSRLDVLNELYQEAANE
jgi:hypothetical protein